MTNIALSFQIIESLVKQGLRHFVVCAGARNAPLIKVLECIQGIEVEEYFEERAAAFYALGISKAKASPVAVVTTSGTAVANLYPAIMEASYSGIPLVAITADRPASYRGSGAPQSVYQPGLFGDHVADSYDFSYEEFEEPQLYTDRPVHLNICFDEPLVDDELNKVSMKLESIDLPSGFSLENFSLPEEIGSYTRPLIILGRLRKDQKDFIKTCLVELGAPVYAEAHSGLREDTELQDLVIHSGELSFGPELFRSHFDSVIRIGSVPSLRLWRDLESELFDVPVASFSQLPFSGLSRSDQVAPIEEVPHFLQSLKILPTQFDELSTLSRLEEAKAQCPNSEVSLLAKWSDSIPDDANILLGNSLPIREWELAKSYESNSFRIYSNRGVNGIDGLIATACGIARGTGKKTYVVLGDLSALYDLSSLALVSRMKSLVKIVVVNNGGGMIFRRIFNDSKFENRHDWSFSQAGGMFGLSYSDQIGSNADLVELLPESGESEKFWSLYNGNTE